ncbi:hypothetical protein ACFGVS_19200 [Mucilaginibacter sp. AW1-7]|jgi:hypothetical protein|uniref:hypothetical protein n=1 Tax=unclassified Mucilaginibacter TaxID=2617802 RepID=UPI002366F6A6|nr:hypothetical protein [Mucilaginibacter sp. KACC 22773]WDF77837.1 hypothetical protein PQ469_28525 [Mucilaginibacter sp. KACC 22773]
MSKNKKGKVVPLKPVQLSAEKYIKTQARLLPIAECIINEDWETAGIANILVARKHKNGNLTIGLFLVDMYCLGPKDALYEFNLSPEKYDEWKDKLAYGIIACDYVLAHNIIYGAVAYAEDYGFKPHKDFEIAQYILEEDSEDIELIEIKFGVDGMPCFVPGPNDSDHKIQTIINTLNRTAGYGNYTFLGDGDDWDDFDDEDWDDDDEEEDDDDDDFDEIQAGINELLLDGYEKISAVYDEVLRTDGAREALKQPFIGLKYRLSNDTKETAYMKFDSAAEENEYFRLLNLASVDHEYDLVITGVRKAIAKYTGSAPWYMLWHSALQADRQHDESYRIAEVMYIAFPDYLPAKVSYANMLIDTEEPEGVLAVFNGQPDLGYVYPDRKVFNLTEAANYYACMCRYFTAIDNIDSADMYMEAIIKNDLTDQFGIQVAIRQLCKAKMEKLGILTDNETADDE